MDFRIPEEVWSGKEVNLSFLKVFGCLSYVHIDPTNRNKLDPKSKKYFFIGYGDAEFGYRFWDDQNRKIIRSRDVIFNEEVMYKDRLCTGADSVYPEVKKAGVIPLNDIPIDGQKDQEAVAPAVDPQTPVGELRRSSRTI